MFYLLTHFIFEMPTIGLNNVNVVNGDINSLTEKVRNWLADVVQLTLPVKVHICDGSQEEADQLTRKLTKSGLLKPLKKYTNCYLCRTDPKDVARVESKTWIVTPNKFDTVTHTVNAVPVMGQWMSPESFETESKIRFSGCMAGRTMYVIPFSMGPIGGAFSKIGVQVTDSAYVVLSMRIMTRISSSLWNLLENSDFVRCVHSVGVPFPLKEKLTNNWLCNPEKTMILHRPAEREIWSFGSGYGGNSLLAKKCFALRIASVIGRDEGWIAEHMLIMSVTNPQGKEFFITAAFPSACGKTNMAMLNPTIPGWKVRCLGDDIAWIRFNKDGQLVAFNPENGFFGVAPGTSNKTNPIAMKTITKNTIFTNVAETADGGFFWEGLEDEMDDKSVEITTWLNEKWKIGQPGKAAHPNARFAVNASQCPIIHPKWDDPNGVPIDAIIFGGRRPEGVPLVFECFSWAHGVFVGACMKSEVTAAAEHTGKKEIMHDPMGMRPFMGYNFGKYLQHWLNLNCPPRKMPKVFHVNWFRKDKNGKFLWPGFCDNIRVLDWICRRLEGEDIGITTPIGITPKKGSINLDSLNETIDWVELFSLPKTYWTEDIKECRKFLEQQLGSDLPPQIKAELDSQEQRINQM